MLFTRLIVTFPQAQKPFSESCGCNPTRCMINLCFSAGAFQTVKHKAQKAVTRVKADKKLCLLTSEWAQGDTHTHTHTHTACRPPTHLVEVLYLLDFCSPKWSTKRTTKYPQKNTGWAKVALQLWAHKSLFLHYNLLIIIFNNNNIIIINLLLPTPV